MIIVALGKLLLQHSYRFQGKLFPNYENLQSVIEIP